MAEKKRAKKEAEKQRENEDRCKWAKRLHAAKHAAALPIAKYRPRFQMCHTVSAIFLIFNTVNVMCAHAG